MITQENFVKHACEQVLRFTQVQDWDDLSEGLKVQLGFNMGVIALGLSLSKEDGFLAFSNVCRGNISMQKFREHLKTLVTTHKIEVDELQITKPF